MTIEKLYYRTRHGDQQEKTALFDRLSEVFRPLAAYWISDPDDVQEIVAHTVATIAAAFPELPPDLTFTRWAYDLLQDGVRRHLEISTGGPPDRRRTPGADAHPAARPSYPVLNQRVLQCLEKTLGNHPDYGRVLSLHSRGYPLKKICSIMGITAQGAFSILSRARASLLTHLEAEGIG